MDNKHMEAAEPERTDAELWRMLVRAVHAADDSLSVLERYLESAVFQTLVETDEDGDYLPSAYVFRDGTICDKSAYIL